MSDAIRVLQELFAKGEISAEEFKSRLAVLQETTSAASGAQPPAEASAGRTSHLRHARPARSPIPTVPSTSSSHACLLTARRQRSASRRVR